MYKIETSLGDIYFNLTKPLEQALNMSDIVFCDDGLSKLGKLYKFGCVYIIKEQNRHFIQIYLDDDYYGSPEYRIISREEWEQVERLKKKIARLKEKIEYLPGNEGFVEAKEHFESLLV